MGRQSVSQSVESDDAATRALTKPQTSVSKHKGRLRWAATPQRVTHKY